MKIGRRQDKSWPIEVSERMEECLRFMDECLVFRVEHERESGMRCFWLRLVSLLIKRWHVARRQLVFILGFFLLPLLAEILIVSILPSPKDIQASLAQNGRIKDAEVRLIPSIYNPHTVVFGSDYTESDARTRLINYIQSSGATVDELSVDTLQSYIRNRPVLSADDLINKYQMAFALFNNLSLPDPSIRFISFFSTINYHAMPTSLGVSATNLFQFYANSSAKKIITTNQPILTSSASFTNLEQLFELIYCFDTLPTSLFNFLNSILAAIFISILIVPTIQERVNRSKDLQLLTNLSKRTYWLSNTLFDSCCCLALSILLTIIIKVSRVSPSCEWFDFLVVHPRSVRSLTQIQRWKLTSMLTQDS